MPKPDNMEPFLKYSPDTGRNRISPAVLADALPYLDWYFRELLPLDQAGVEIDSSQSFGID